MLKTSEKNISTTQVSNLHTCAERRTIRTWRRGEQAARAGGDALDGKSCQRLVIRCGQTADDRESPFHPWAGRKGGPVGAGAGLGGAKALRPCLARGLAVLPRATAPEERCATQQEKTEVACPLTSGLSFRSGLAPGVECGLGVVKEPTPTGLARDAGGWRVGGGSVAVTSALELKVKSWVWIRRFDKTVLLKTVCVFIYYQSGRKKWAEATGLGMPAATSGVCLEVALWCPAGDSRLIPPPPPGLQELASHGEHRSSLPSGPRVQTRSQPGPGLWASCTPSLRLSVLPWHGARCARPRQAAQRALEGAAHGAEAGGQLGFHLLLASVCTRGAGPSVPPGSPWDSLRPCPEEVTRACARTWLLGGEVGRTMGSHLKSLRGVVPCSVCVVGVHSESWKTSMTRLPGCEAAYKTPSSVYFCISVCIYLRTCLAIM